MENELIYAVVNAELGIRAEVKTHKLGYFVAVYDLDAEQYFPAMVIVPKLETAIAKADHAASKFEVAA